MITSIRTVGHPHLNRFINLSRSCSVIPLHTATRSFRSYKGSASSVRKDSLFKVFLLKPTSTQTAAMSRDHTNQSDIGKMKTEADGSFNRKASTFRNTIEKGGKFEPEKGQSMAPSVVYRKLETDKCAMQTVITFTSHTPVVGVAIRIFMRFSLTHS